MRTCQHRKRLKKSLFKNLSKNRCRFKWRINIGGNYVIARSYYTFWLFYSFLFFLHANVQPVQWALYPVDGFIAYMCVNHRGFYARMPKQQLDISYVDPCFYQMCCKRVTQVVHTSLFRQAAFFKCPSHHFHCQNARPTSPC